MATARRGPARGARWIAAGLTAVSLLALAFTMAERAMHRAAPRHTAPDASLGEPMHWADQMVVAEASCFAATAPGASIDLYQREGGLTMRIETDAEGFRVGAPARPAACRVVVVGDSWTAGSWVAGAEAFPAVTEEILRSRGYSVRVLNGGMQGFSIAQERVAVLSRWATPRPDVVVIATSSNDLDDLANFTAMRCSLEVPPASRIHPWARLEGPAVTEMRAQLVALERRLFDATGGRVGGSAAARLAACEASTRSYINLAGEIVTTLRARGTRVMFDLLQSPQCNVSGPPGYWLGREDFARELSARVVASGGEALANPGFLFPQMTLMPHDAHPSAQGHRYFAEVLATRLVALGWLEHCRAPATTAPARVTARRSPAPHRPRP